MAYAVAEGRRWPSACEISCRLHDGAVLGKRIAPFQHADTAGARGCRARGLKSVGTERGQIDVRRPRGGGGGVAHPASAPQASLPTALTAHARWLSIRNQRVTATYAVPTHRVRSPTLSYGRSEQAAQGVRHTRRRATEGELAQPAEPPGRVRSPWPPRAPQAKSPSEREQHRGPQGGRAEQIRQHGQQRRPARTSRRTRRRRRSATAGRRGRCPSSSRAWISSACSGSRDSCRATSRASPGSTPARLVQRGELVHPRPPGACAAPAARRPARPRRAHAARRRRCTRRRPWRRRRRRGPRGPVMTMVCWPTEPPATPVISARLETRPSIAPNTAGRSQPPFTSRCVWLSRCASCSAASVSMMRHSLPVPPSSLLGLIPLLDNSPTLRYRIPARQQGRLVLTCGFTVGRSFDRGVRTDVDRVMHEASRGSGEPLRWDRSAKGSRPVRRPPRRGRVWHPSPAFPRSRRPGTPPNSASGPAARCSAWPSGDALGAPAENMKPSEIRARWGRITGYVAEHPAGTDDTEYAIFSGLLLARHGSALTVAHVEAAWHQWIADRDEGPFRGAGFSERGTLENLRRGLAAPISAQHRHAWSDGLAMRAAPFGVFAAGRPAEAARLVAIDGSVSHDGEGIYGGQAVAAGVAAAMAGAPADRRGRLGPGRGPRRLLDGPLPAPRGGAVGPPRRTRGPLRRRHRRLPLDRPGPRGGRPRLRRVRGGRRRLRRRRS